MSAPTPAEIAAACIDVEQPAEVVGLGERYDPGPQAELFGIVLPEILSEGVRADADGPTSERRTV